MFDLLFIQSIVDCFLFFACLFLLFGSVFISIKTRFVQLRLMPSLVNMMINSFRDHPETAHTIQPHRALFAAMSTTLGIGTIVGPVIAIHWGGPGALLGFLLTSFFGSAVTFTEVNLSVKYRSRHESGRIQGGPMQYLSEIFSPWAAKWYALFGALLMASWSSAQANQLVAIFDSPLMGDYRIPTIISGMILSVLILTVLIGGIKRISSLSAKIVPTMFVLYLGSSLYILFSNIDQLGNVLTLIFTSAFYPHALVSGGLVGGVFSALRWGILKGTQATEAGVGTQTIPHSMAETENSVAQGTLAMFSTYSAGVVAFISGCVSLMTNTWQDPELPLGVSMVAASFQMYYSSFGVIIVTVSTLLFAFGTILGNSYNGSQCFGYLTKSKWVNLYYVLSTGVIFLGTIVGVETVWSMIDLTLVCLVLPHMAALMIHVSRKTGMA